MPNREIRNRDTGSSSRSSVSSSKNDLVQRLMREREAEQHSDHAAAVPQSLDSSEPSKSQERQMVNRYDGRLRKILDQKGLHADDKQLMLRVVRTQIHRAMIP